jgi:hypothetical protein
VIENKQSREIIDSAPIMIPTTYDQGCETFRFAKHSFRFRGLWAWSTPETKRPVGKPFLSLGASDPGELEVGPKKLRKRAAKALESFVRVNLCAGASGRRRSSQARPVPSLAQPGRPSPDRNQPPETARARRSQRICAPRSPRETFPPKASPPPLPSARAGPRPASS